MQCSSVGGAGTITSAQITGLGGQSSNSLSVSGSYAAPAPSSVSPTSLNTAGGDSLYIYGNNLVSRCSQRASRVNACRYAGRAWRVCQRVVHGLEHALRAELRRAELRTHHLHFSARR